MIRIANQLANLVIILRQRNQKSLKVKKRYFSSQKSNVVCVPALLAILLCASGFAHADYNAGTNSSAQSATNIYTVSNRPDGTAVPYLVYTATAVGDNAVAGTPSTSGATAMGFGATASGNYSTAIGSAALASGKSSTALGVAAEAAGSHSTAIGLMAETQANEAVAIGDSAYIVSSGTYGLAFGTNSFVSGANGIALGAGASVTTANSVALGNGSTTSAAVATTGATIGGTSYGFAGTSPVGTVSIGSAGNERTLTNVAAGQLGASSTDGVNGSQLFATNQQVTQNSTDISNLANSVNNGTIGLVQQDSATGAITVGQGAGGALVNFAGSAGSRVLTGVSAGAVGAASADAVNGSQLYATNQQIAQNTTDIANLQSSVTNMSAQAENTLSYDSSARDSITLGGSGATSTVAVHNVAAATADTDAVNLGQMNAAIAQVQNIAQDGGNPLFSANGNTATEAANASGTHATAAGALAVASGREATALGANASASADNSVALGAGSVADRASTVSVGSAGNERQITNVAAGTQGTDAVNVSQLNSAVANAGQQATQNANAYTDSKVAGLNSTINDVAKASYAGIAAAMAMPNLTPSAPGKTVVAGGGGYYKGGSAAAVGATYRSQSGRWLTNAAASITSTGDAGVRVQVGYEF